MVSEWCYKCGHGGPWQRAVTSVHIALRCIAGGGASNHGDGGGPAQRTAPLCMYKKALIDKDTLHVKH